MKLTLDDVVFQYSEWLDDQGIIRSEEESKDQRSHDALVKQFLAEHEHVNGQMELSTPEKADDE